MMKTFCSSLPAPLVVQVLEADRSDHEIVNYAIETLVNVTSPETFQEEMGKSRQTNARKKRSQ